MRECNGFVCRGLQLVWLFLLFSNRRVWTVFNNCLQFNWPCCGVRWFLSWVCVFPVWILSFPSSRPRSRFEAFRLFFSLWSVGFAIFTLVWGALFSLVFPFRSIRFACWFPLVFLPGVVWLSGRGCWLTFWLLLWIWIWLPSWCPGRTRGWSLLVCGVRWGSSWTKGIWGDKFLRRFFLSSPGLFRFFLLFLSVL